MRLFPLVFSLFCCRTSLVSAFVVSVGGEPVNVLGGTGGAMIRRNMASSSSSEAPSSSQQEVAPEDHDGTTSTAYDAASKENNVAQYLVDLHDSKATFDFCGGMLFQLVLTDKLREHLVKVSSSSSPTKDAEDYKQPVVFDASYPRMHQIPAYPFNSAQADNVRVFHGREIRQAREAAGGMGMVLQLSLANGDDPEGWTPAEIRGYDGWKHDAGRVWRNGDQLEREGLVGFKNKFGEQAYTLNHRFYWHLDQSGAIWLAAEDGCEGTPVQAQGRSFFSPFSKLLGL